MVLGVTSAPAQAQQPPQGDGTRAAQVLNWTASDDITRYTSAPETAVAGAATLVFENSEATGNTTSMPHTLTFVTNDPDYNDDVNVNILANPSDAQGGKHSVEVTLTPGTYKYHCTIPGHGQMQGTLVVTDGGGGEDTTPPETSAEVDGDQNADGAYVGMATVTVTASDAGSGVDTIEYAMGDGGYQAYTEPVMVHEVGAHTVRFRATDKDGNIAEEKTVEFTVVAPPTDDTTPPETSATVDGEQDADGAYVGMA
ncbi:MAG TPA: plastocyanin/azurin family copper-binding protein, partial [Streptomyces sp.]|nr:plastocyanin/azurin family copper-binding protein [Streptomyces sp.]